MNRRTFLGGCSSAAIGLALSSNVETAAAESGARKRSFIHCAYNGWITELATEPTPEAVWPCLDVDDWLLADYRTTFRLMSRLGFNEIVIWGIYVANNWPLDIKSCIDARRARQIERLLASAHENGIKVLCGLGTYSWGFGEIIRAHPGLSRGNPNAMCGSIPESHTWMQRVVDFAMDRFPLDGVSMQSADQGRCRCKDCSKLTDAEYHADLNIRVAEYIHSKWPGKIVGMSNWGLGFGNPKDKPALVKMSRSLDYMIDYNDSARSGEPSYRRELLASLTCAAGTSGGLVVEPPEHWARDRWFLPTCRNVHGHIQKLAADGGRAVEFFYHILANPSSEVTFHVAGRTLSDPGISLEKALGETLDELYSPKTVAIRDALGKFFLDAEEAYMQYQPGEGCGDISLEPLYCDRPGPAIYLRDRLTTSQRTAYANSLQRLADGFARLRTSVPFTPRSDRIAGCLKQVLKELATFK